MRIILDEVEREIAENCEASAREALFFHLHRFTENKSRGYSLPIVARDLTFLYEGLIEWTFLMDEPALSSLFLTTIPLACYVRINAESGRYESAMYLLARENDQITIIADTERALVSAFISDQSVFYLKLPFADAVQDITRKLFEAAAVIRDLNSFTGPTGEPLTVLFER